MNKELKLISEIPPSVNHYLAYRIVHKGGRYIPCSYETKDSTSFKKKFIKYVAEEVEKQGWVIPDDKTQQLYVDTIFYFPRIDMDCNNYFKVLLDAITDTGLVWKDDNIVCERVSRILYDAKNPHIEILIHPVEHIGIFDNNEQLNKFEEHCKGCSRYLKNCSLLNRIKAGYIMEGISQDDCFFYKGIKNKEDIA